MKSKILHIFCEKILEHKMYHGTNFSFHTPKDGKIFWVTTSKELAQEYANGSIIHRGGGKPIVYEHDVDVKHPANVTDEYSPILRLLSKWYDNRPNKESNKEEVLKIINDIRDTWNKIGLDNSETATYNHWNMSGEEGNQLLIKFLKALGYDSIHFVEQGYDTYGLFEPGMIKHALS